MLTGDVDGSNPHFVIEATASNARLHDAAWKRPIEADFVATVWKGQRMALAADESGRPGIFDSRFGQSWSGSAAERGRFTFPQGQGISQSDRSA